MSDSGKAFLVAVRDGGYGERRELSAKSRATLGRAGNSTLVLGDELSSREHAEVYAIQGAWYVRDKNSLNGSKLNGSPFKGEALVRSGDELQFGRSKYLFVTSLKQLPPAGELPNETVDIRLRQRETRFLTPLPDLEHEMPAKLASDVSRLFQAGVEMAAAQTAEDLFGIALDALLGDPAVGIAAILEVSGGRELAEVAYKDRSGRNSFHHFSKFISTEVMQSGEAIIADSVSTSAKLRKRESLTDMKVASLICAPVRVGDDTIGLIHLYGADTAMPLDGDLLDFTLALAKPLALAWRQIRRHGALRTEVADLREQVATQSEIISGEGPMRDAEELATRAAHSNAAVLVRGESGTGKELIARTVHDASRRHAGPFVTMNCAAIAESLLESELFGHEKGAFTGATERMIGKFEASDKGTIFLDEIGEMPLSIQAKFLRVLEGHPFERLGGNARIKVDVRVVAATNRDLERDVRDGRFRMDLFFRLQVVEIVLPPLRERPGDVPLLAEHFLKKFSRETGRKLSGFSPEAERRLVDYSWPGNVRELRNAIERVVVLAPKGASRVEASDVRLTSLAPDAPDDGEFQPRTLDEVEGEHIARMLEFTGWNKSRTAELLGVERSTLDRKIKTYDLKKPN